MTESAVVPETERVRRSKMLLPIDLLRGFLIGMAELVPGVSGGTVALVTGVYDELIDSASHAISSLKRLVLGPDRLAGFSQEIRRTDWWLVGPVLVGMAAAVLTVAGVMEAFVTGHPEQARGLFFGMVLVSLAVPLLMLPARVKGNRVLDVVIVAVAAVVAFVLTGLAGGGATSEPAAIVVFLAAAVAICALVIPGVSGSFFLLAVGLYTTTLDAVHERDLGYIAVFGAGAIVGLASFVQLLKYLLHNHRRITLLVMTGLMLGSLRALWPWQSAPESAADDAHGPGALIAPYAPVAGPILLMLVGAAIVAVLVWVEFRGKSEE
jgi:putative membrane protein